MWLAYQLQMVKVHALEHIPCIASQPNHGYDLQDVVLTCSSLRASQRWKATWCDRKRADFR